MNKNFVSGFHRLLQGIMIFSVFLSMGQLPASSARAMGESGEGVIAYVKQNDGPEDQIRLIDPDGQNDRFLWSSGNMGTDIGLRTVKNLDWKPDGSELAFASRHQAACSQYEYDVYSIRANGSNLRRIPYKPYCGEITGLPTGTVEVTFINGSSSSNVFILYFEGAPAPQSSTIPGGGSVTVTFQNVVDYGSATQYAVAMWGTNRALAYDGGVDVIPGQTVQVELMMSTVYDNWSNYTATWNYDGTQIAYFFWQDTNPYGIPASEQTPGVEGSHLLESASNYWDLPLDRRYLAYGPTQALSNKLLYAGYSPTIGDGGDHIFLATVGQVEPGQIVINSTDLDGYSFMGLAWLPDGSGFVFSMEEDFGDRANIFRYSFSTGQSTRLTDYPTYSWTRWLSVSPDGTQVVYELQSEGENWWDNPPMDLYVMNIDGSDNRLFVAGGRSPAWGAKYVASDHPAPVLAGISPSSANAGGAGFTLTASGSSFVNGSVVRWDGAALTTTYVNATTLTAQVPAGKIAAAGTASVTVFTPAPGGGASGAKTFTINGSLPTNTAPVLTGLNPSMVAPGGAGFTLTASGNNFVSGSVLRWNGADLPTTYVNATTLTAPVPASMIAEPGVMQVSVTNPGSGGGTSASTPFMVIDPSQLNTVYLPFLVDR